MDTPTDGKGYHIADIIRGKFGDFSKIIEEVNEAQDAIDQNNKIMVLVELSDIIAAIKGYLDKNFPGITIDDLVIMAATTDRAFKNGHRRSRD